MLDKIKQIKRSRLKPYEIFFLDTIDGIESYTLFNYPNIIFWKKMKISYLKKI